jgi:hypothetical protein
MTQIESVRDFSKRKQAKCFFSHFSCVSYNIGQYQLKNDFRGSKVPVSLAIREGYVPEKYQTSNTKTVVPRYPRFLRPQIPKARITRTDCTFYIDGAVRSTDLDKLNLVQLDYGGLISSLSKFPLLSKK